MANMKSQQCVRLSISKFILLHLKHLHFLYCIKCRTHLDTTDIVNLMVKDTFSLKVEYVESIQSVIPITGLGDIKISKLTYLKWSNFKLALTNLLRRSLGQHKTPLLYVIRDANTSNFNDVYDDCQSKRVLCISHTGSAFKADNNGVYSILV